MLSNYEKVKAWRKANPEKVAEQARRRYKKKSKQINESRAVWREKTREVRLPIEAAQARARRAKDPEGQRIRHERWKAKQLAQREITAGRPKPDVCEVCSLSHLRICFDHCHVSGKFRGWICDDCNIALGKCKDSPETLRKLADYLEKQCQN